MAAPVFDAPAWRWRVLGGMVCVYFTFGVAVSSIAPMLNEVRHDLGASRGEMGLALGAWAFMFIFSAPFAGRFIDRFGIGPAVALGGVSIVASMTARSGAQGVGTLWLAIAIFGVFGSLISAAAPTLVATWFPDERERRRAVGLYAVAPGIGGVAVLFVTNPFLLPWLGSWRGVLLAEAVLGASAVVVWLLIFARADKPTREHDIVTRPRGHLVELARSPGVRLALGMAFTVFFVNHGVRPWLPAALEELGGHSPSVASNWAALSGIAGIVVAVIVPNGATPERVRLVVAGMLGVLAVSLTAMAYGPEWLVGPAAVTSASRAALVPVGILILMEADGVTSANAGLANGVWFAVGEIGGVSGPLVVGAIADTSAGFPGSLMTVAAVSVATAVGLMALRPRARTELSRPRPVG